MVGLKYWIQLLRQLCIQKDSVKRHGVLIEFVTREWYPLTLEIFGSFKNIISKTSIKNNI